METKLVPSGNRAKKNGKRSQRGNGSNQKNNFFNKSNSATSRNKNRRLHSRDKSIITYPIFIDGEKRYVQQVCDVVAKDFKTKPKAVTIHKLENRKIVCKISDKIVASVDSGSLYNLIEKKKIRFLKAEYRDDQVFTLAYKGLQDALDRVLTDTNNYEDFKQQVLSNPVPKNAYRRQKIAWKKLNRLSKPDYEKLVSFVNKMDAELESTYLGTVKDAESQEEVEYHESMTFAISPVPPTRRAVWDTDSESPHSLSISVLDQTIHRAVWCDGVLIGNMSEMFQNLVAGPLPTNATTEQIQKRREIAMDIFAEADELEKGVLKYSAPYTTLLRRTVTQTPISEVQNALNDIEYDNSRNGQRWTRRTFAQVSDEIKEADRQRNIKHLKKLKRQGRLPVFTHGQKPTHESTKTLEASLDVLEILGGGFTNPKMSEKKSDRIQYVRPATPSLLESHKYFPHDEVMVEKAERQAKQKEGEVVEKPSWDKGFWGQNVIMSADFEKLVKKSGIYDEVEHIEPAKTHVGNNSHTDANPYQESKTLMRCWENPTL